ncbi:MAG TPA: ABC transporter permease [Thermoanaerobaculia bacterium]|nr:ABC transporter permease [Thermoanaerobaculia bacterium]HUM30375.1 ABC transporter permease [Thermoanaerobaculia bacterium]HXK68614.1 ABC transporter permease [Thermoanaerobaculia bacterium]
MDILELSRYVIGALRGHRLRSGLSALGIAIGVFAVILLTSLGEGTRDYIVSQFTQFGTSIIAINPGNVKTVGIPGIFGGTTQFLTIDDAESLRHIPGVRVLTPVAMGQARVEAEGKGRSVYIYGVGHEALEAWQFSVAQGMFLPAIDPHRQGAFTVLGPKLAHEIFGEESPLGKRVRMGGRSLLVVGVMEPKGQLLGFDLDDAAYIPVATSLALFNLPELQEIDVVASTVGLVDPVAEGVRALLKERHRGEEDFTITTQNQMLDTFGKIISIITVAVSAIAAISLLVGAVGILTIMWISVQERTGEIGLLRALGVSPRGIQGIFLLEAVILSIFGGVIGLGLGFVVQALIRGLVPGIPLKTPPEAVIAALLMSLLVGMFSGFLPARRASRLDPVEALRAE